MKHCDSSHTPLGLEEYHTGFGFDEDCSDVQAWGSTGCLPRWNVQYTHTTVLVYKLSYVIPYGAGKKINLLMWTFTSTTEQLPCIEILCPGLQNVWKSDNQVSQGNDGVGPDNGESGALQDRKHQTNVFFTHRWADLRQKDMRLLCRHMYITWV